MTDSLSEREPLLPSTPSSAAPKKPWYRPRPLWLVSCAIISSLCRGLVTAPRTEIVVQIACQNYWRDQPHHTGIPVQFNSSQSLSFSSSLRPTRDSSEYVNCATNADVQAAAAKLQTIMTTTMGLLSALSTGRWGQFGDYHGRTKVLAAAQFGILFTDAMYLIASNPPDSLKHHSQMLLLISPIVEGTLGGLTTITSATHAYISDCTSHGSRAQIFSRFTGVTYIGFALGPEIAALILRSTGRTTPVFLTSVVLAALNWIFVLFIIPESITPELKERNIKLGNQRRATSHANVPDKVGFWRTIRKSGKAFMEPLILFAPAQRQQGRGLDWTLTLLAIAMFCFQLSVGVIQLKYLYAKHLFDWSAETLSYYITAGGTIRAIHLLVILPVVIALTKPVFKRWHATGDLETNTEAGAASTTDADVAEGPTTAADSNLTKQKKTPPTPVAILSEIKFDLRVARFSLFVDFLSHSLVSVASSSSGPRFVGFSLMNSLGTGLVPALHSIAMCTLYLRERNADGIDASVEVEVEESGKGGKDIGKLFGSLAILQAVGTSILGPLLFGSVYSITVSSFPKAIFIVAAALIAIAILMLFLIRPPRIDPPIQIRVETHVRTTVERVRGRSRGQKDIAEELRLGEALNY